MTDTNLYLNRVLLALHDECRARGTHPATHAILQRFILEAFWVNGKSRYDRVDGREISLAELASWGLCSKSQAQRARRDDLFQQLIEMVDGDRGRNRLPRASVKEGRIYSTLQARLERGVSQGDQPKSLGQGDQGGLVRETNPGAGVSHIDQPVSQGDQGGWSDRLTGLVRETKGVSQGDLINRIVESVECQNRVERARSPREQAPDPSLDECYSSRDEVERAPGFRISSAARDAPYTDNQPAKRLTSDSLPQDKAQLADYIKALPPTSVLRQGSAARLAPKGWRKEPLFQAIAELCRRHGEQSPGAMTKITERLSEAYLDGGHELVHALVAEAAVRFLNEPHSKAGFAPSYVLLGHLSKSTGAGDPVIDTVSAARKRIRF